MARRRKSSTPRIVIAVAILALIAAGLWVAVSRMRSTSSPLTGAAVVVTDRVDPANEGGKVRVSGKLEITRPPRDPQLGIGADAAILFRKVEMYQWREHCEGSDCRYDTMWLGQSLDSRKFRTPAGHENSTFPFVDTHFAAGEIRLGAFAVDPELVATQLPTIAHAVTEASLPPNLAASFREVDGMYYAGGDSAHPVVGAVRVSYRIVPTGAATLTGVQRGAKLMAN